MSDTDRLNCFRVVMAEEARRDAKKAEQAAYRGDKPGPLHTPLDAASATGIDLSINR